jgi:hypothetical protein
MAKEFSISFGEFIGHVLHEKEAASKGQEDETPILNIHEKFVEFCFIVKFFALLLDPSSQR